MDIEISLSLSLVSIEDYKTRPYSIFDIYLLSSKAGQNCRARIRLLGIDQEPLTNWVEKVVWIERIQSTVDNSPPVRLNMENEEATFTVLSHGVVSSVEIFCPVLGFTSAVLELNLTNHTTSLQPTDTITICFNSIIGTGCIA